MHYLYAPPLNSTATLIFTLPHCRSTLIKFGSLKYFAASSNQNTIVIIESWRNDETPNNVSSLAGYQFLEVLEMTTVGGGCPA